MAPHIRTFQAADQPMVILLWNTVFPNDPPWNAPAEVIARKIALQDDLFLVCSLNDEIVGTVIAGFDGVRGWVHKLAVLPAHQRRGIASTLMQAAEQRLIAVGCPKLNLQVRASNKAVVDFYEKLGYSVEDRVSMGKRLQQ